MANPIIGEIEPQVVIQEDDRACLSACLLSVSSRERAYTEADVSQLLIKAGIYEEGMGTGLYPAHVLDKAAEPLGLQVKPVFDARGKGEDEELRITERLAAVERALTDGQQVIVAYPKRRPGQATLLHYSVITGFRDDPEGNGVVVMDPSDVDGGIYRPRWEDLQQYVTPSDGVPVMAWGVKAIDDTLPKREAVVQATKDNGLPGISLLMRPMYAAEDIGAPIPPGTNHNSSVAMTTAEITKQFAEYAEIVLSRNGEQPTGYPRFVILPQIREVSGAITGSPKMLPFASRKAAEAAAYLENTYASSTEITEKGGLFWLPDSNLNAKAWQNTGLGISSRQAAAVLEGRPDNNLARRSQAEAEIKSRIAEYTGAEQEDIYLFSTGMAAIYGLNRALIEVAGDAPSIQFGFPYTDTYDLRHHGPNRNIKENVIDYRSADYDALRGRAKSEERIRAVFTEAPSNPLLWTPDFARLDNSLDGRTPIVVDDTIASIYNLDDAKLPDSVVARVTSLTKFFSSVGNVMGGSIVLRPQSPHYDALKAALDEQYEDLLWYEDAEALAQNSRLFPGFMPRINANGEAIATWLSEEHANPNGPLEAVYHPSVQNREAFDVIKKPEGGYSGLVSLRFKNPDQAFAFFDEMRITKGPSLGTYYSLGCLYTLLAHKHVETVAPFGVTPDLVRLSLGIENTDDLQGRLTDAFEASKRATT